MTTKNKKRRIRRKSKRDNMKRKSPENDSESYIPRQLKLKTLNLS